MISKTKAKENFSYNMLVLIILSIFFTDSVEGKTKLRTLASELGIYNCKVINTYNINSSLAIGSDITLNLDNLKSKNVFITSAKSGKKFLEYNYSGVDISTEDSYNFELAKPLIIRSNYVLKFKGVSSKQYIIRMGRKGANVPITYVININYKNSNAQAPKAIAAECMRRN